MQKTTESLYSSYPKIYKLAQCQGEQWVQKTKEIVTLSHHRSHKDLILIYTHTSLRREFRNRSINLLPLFVPNCMIINKPSGGLHAGVWEFSLTRASVDRASRHGTHVWLWVSFLSYSVGPWNRSVLDHDEVLPVFIGTIPDYCLRIPIRFQKNHHLAVWRSIEPIETGFEST